MHFVRLTALCLLIACTIHAPGCGAGGSAGEPSEPAFSAVLFGAGSHNVTNPYHPLVPGSVALFQNETDDGMETIVSEVLQATRVVAGVTCRCVRVREWLGELITEDTEDWYAQDLAGNVWYMGEVVVNYEYDDDDNLIGTDGDGSWEAGADPEGTGTAATPGIIMKAILVLGDTYRQELYPTIAEDMGQVDGIGIPLTLSCGTTYTCLRIRDWDPLEPGVFELKYYAPGVGLVAEEEEGGDEIVEMRATLLPTPASLPNFAGASFSNPTTITNPLFPFPVETMQGYVKRDDDEGETVISEVLDEVRIVSGVTCRVVRVLEFEGELLVEDTSDWYAQDDAGNVWYMGEFVINYEYDDDDNLIGTDNDGSWEAGVDGAIPGILMWANPVVGQSYYQELYAGEAEDLGVVIATNQTLTLDTGITYTGCLKTLDWTPLEPEALEFKYYAPGVGLIVEVPLDGESNRLELQGTKNVSLSTLPDFNAATFTNPTTIDNPFLPYAPGSSWTYEVDTEDGTETILVETLPTTRVVNGVTCVVVRDRVWLEGLLIEDTHDWFAQDDAGNVWYMGEETVNYEYDDDDNLIGTDTEGAWEAGVDGALPGILMWATPVVGTSYFQEYYEDEAEDMATVIATGVTVTLDDGTVYTNCLQTFECTALEPYALEFKFYAPGIGVVLELSPADGERLELTAP